MGLFDRPKVQESDSTQQLQEQFTHLAEQLSQEQANTDFLQESIAQLELALEDADWQRLIIRAQQEFTREGLRTATELSRLMAIANPLLKRGLAIRTAYVWAGGVTVTARDSSDELTDAQDLNVVIQAFIDDKGNRAALTGVEAQQELERFGLGTDGNVLLSLWTNPLTGRVQVRQLPWDEIQDKITDPNDQDVTWYFLRCWEAQEYEPESGRWEIKQRKAYYPALGYRPNLRPKSIGEIPVEWDAPVRHVKVNVPHGWKFGIGDAYAVLPWVKAYKEFLEDWARVVKALSRFAWQTKTPGSKAAKVRDAVKTPPTTSTRTGDPLAAGATAVTSPNITLEAIGKSGATIDSDSGRPIAALVAAGLDIPVTMLLGDPGTTGARATAETLDKPTELTLSLRRDLWVEVYEDVLAYVVDQAIKAPRGPLKGTRRIDRDTGQEIITLAGDQDRTLDITFKDLTEDSLKERVDSIVAADGTMKLPELVIARLLLEALGVADVDEILEHLTDEQGNFKAPQVTAGDVAVGAFNRGEDPVEALR